MRRFNLFVLALGLMLAAAGARAAETPFQALALEEALAKAQSENKWVLIHFVGGKRCEDCSAFDALTWRDEKVKAWLAEHTIALEIDTDNDPAPAKRYKVEDFPSILMLTPAGEEIAREDSLIPRAFIRWTQSLRDGIPVEQRIARRKLWAPLQVKLDYADGLEESEKQPEAVAVMVEVLKEAVAEIGRGGEDDQNISAWAAYGLAELSEYPGAEAALAEARAEVERMLREDGVTTGRAELLETLNDQLEESTRTLALFDEIKGKTDESGLRVLRRAWQWELDNDERYEDMAESIRLPEVVDFHLRTYREEAGDRAEARELLTKIKRKDGVTTPTIHLASRLLREIDYPLHATRDKLVKVYEILLRVGRTEDAAEVARRTLEFDPSGMAHNNLAWVGFETGKLTEEHMRMAEKAMELEGRRNMSTIDTQIRILNELGHKEEAKKEFDEAVRRSMLAMQGNLEEGIEKPDLRKLRLLELLRDDLIASGTLTAPPGWKRRPRPVDEL